MLEANFINPTNDGWYVYHHQPVNLGCDYQAELLSGKVQQCTCCARGALLVSKTANYDGFETGGNGYSYKLGASATIDGLADTFTAEELYLIEVAYEKTARYYAGDEFEKAQRAMQMYPVESTSAERLIMICNNIIENNGEFVIPED